MTKELKGITQITKHRYFISFELPNEEDPAKRKSWQIVSTDKPLNTGAELEQVLSHFLIMLSAEPPIYPVSVDYLGTQVTELPDNEVVVYQMGKVGSTSVRDALQSSDLEVYHVHYMQDYGEFGTRKDPRFLDRIKNSDDVWLFISLVRNPIHRNISAFFWALKEYYDGDPTVFSQGMVDAFVNNYPAEYTLEWFDKELNKTLDYDIYASPFMKHTGFTMYERLDGPKRPNFRLMVIRTEDLTRVFKKAIHSFMLLDIPEIGKKNTTQHRKPIAPVSLEFVQKAVLPQRYLDEVLTHKYTNHFYTPEEIKEFYEYWSSTENRV